MNWMRTATALIALAPVVSYAVQKDTPAAENGLAARVSAHARAAAGRWGVNPTVRIVEDGAKLEALENGRIDVPMAKLRELLLGIPDVQADAVIAWLMAHEVWHQVQFRDGWKLVGASDRDKRLRECAADTMGAYAVMDANLSTRISKPDEQAMRELSAAISQIIDAAERLETGNLGRGNHPDANARRAALQAGFGRAVQERVYQLSNDPGRGLLRDRLAKLYDIRAGETTGAWSLRMCESVLHSGNGVEDLAIGTPQFNWNESGDPPIVDYRIPYRNVGTNPIKVTMQIRSVSVPRLSREDRGKWTVADLNSYSFILNADASYDVVGRLQWIATDDVMPKLVFPKAAESYFDVVRLGPVNTGATPKLVSALGREASELQATLSALFNAAPGRFGAVSANCETYSSFRMCDLTLAVVGASKTHVTIDQDGSSNVTLVVYEGSSEIEAAAAYSRFRRWLRSIYPTLAFDERSRPEGRDEVSMKPAPTATLTLYKRKKSSGDFEVIALIKPALF